MTLLNVYYANSDRKLTDRVNMCLFENAAIEQFNMSIYLLENTSSVIDSSKANSLIGLTILPCSNLCEWLFYECREFWNATWDV